MYNKLKNIVSFKLKFEDYSAKLLEINNKNEVIKNFLLSNEVNFFEDIVKNELNNKFFIGIFKDDELLLLLFNLIENQNKLEEMYSDLFIINKQFLNILDNFFLKLKNDLLLTLKISNFSVNLNKNNKELIEIFKKNGFIQEIEDSEKIVLSTKIEKIERTLESKCFKNDKLVFFPSKREEQLEIYSIMKKWFKIGTFYSEIEISNIIKLKIECKDFATLRRDMFDSGFLKRNSEGTKYWVE